MTWFDYAVIAIILFSALLGWWRGLVYEVLSLVSWVAAGVTAKLFAARMAHYMPSMLEGETSRTAAAFVSLFLLVLAVGGVVAWLVSKLVKSIGLGWLDGLMGIFFGLIRGALVVVLIMLLAGTTGLPQLPDWRNAATSRPLESVALLLRAALPESVAERVHY
jgi:membrane protein required for colicin V production